MKLITSFTECVLSQVTPPLEQQFIFVLGCTPLIFLGPINFLTVSCCCIRLEKQSRSLDNRTSYLHLNVELKCSDLGILNVKRIVNKLGQTGSNLESLTHCKPWKGLEVDLLGWLHYILFAIDHEHRYSVTQEGPFLAPERWSGWVRRTHIRR